MYRVLIVSLFALVSVSPNATAQDPRVRDSAGVKIIENGSLKDAPLRFTLGDKPLLEVGGIESNPDDEFDHKQGYLRGVRLSNGGLAVIDVYRIHYFDPQGKRVRIVGRNGQGPEEFQYLIAICRTRGDTIVVYDNRNRRTTILDGSGKFIRTILQEDNGSASNDSCLDDGSFVLDRRSGAPGQSQSRLTRLRADGSVVNVIGTFDASGFDMVTQTVPSLLVSGASVYHGNPFENEIRVFDVMGTLKRIIRGSDRGDRITDAEAEERLARTIPTNMPAAQRTAQLERMRALPRASRNWPVFYKVLVGADGMVWVQHYEKAFALSRFWTAIDTAGRIVGRLEIPPAPEGTFRPEVHSFGRDYVMMRRFDKDGASMLTLYPLIRIDGRSR